MMPGRRVVSSRVFVRALPALIACACLRVASSAAFLVQGGQPGADIVTAPDPPRMTVLAASELRDHLFKITGASLDIVTAPGTNVAAHLFVGRSAHTDALGLSTNGLDYDAFRIVSGTNWLALLGYDADYVPTGPYAVNRHDIARMLSEWDGLTGATWGSPHQDLWRDYSITLDLWKMDQRGSLNAVYAFLRGLGCRWFFPGSMGEVLPAMQDIPLPQTHVVVHPDFPVRHINQYYTQFWFENKDEILWQLRLGLNSGEERMGSARAHGIQNVISRDETRAAHPEYYALWGGIRQTNGPDPCLSHPGLYTQNVAYARAVFDIYDEPMISVMPTDGYATLCECALCQGKGTPERGYSGRLSDYVWGYVNDVATNLYATHPDRKVLCGAYTTYQLPPTNLVTLSPNMAAILCRWRSNFHDPAAFSAYTNLVTSWLDILPSREIYIYDYYLHSERDAWIGVPVYFPRVIAQDLRFLKGKSKGEYVEVQRNWDGWDRDWHALAANHLNVYVTSRLYWDAEQDLDALLDDYYATFYGPAAAEMKVFVEFCEAHWPAMRQSKAVLDQALALLDAARAVAGTGVHADRILLLTDFMRPLVTLRDSMADHYVAQNGQTPQAPHITWETAASNLQAAITLMNVDTVLKVGPGRYTLPVDAPDFGGPTIAVIDKPLAMLSASGNPADTVIDGQGVCRGIAIRHPRSTSNRFVIDGFSFINCLATNTGGAIALSSGNYGLPVTLRNCVFDGNTVVWGDTNSYFATAGSRGGAIGNYETQPPYVLAISNCVFRGNRALHGAAGSGNPGQGGAIFLRGGYKTIRLANCLFENNRATSGGAVANEFAGLVADGCIFRDNAAELLDSGVLWSSTTAGAVYASYGTSVFRNCLAYGNSSEGRAGFLYMPYGKANLDNCTIVNNTCANGIGGISARFNDGELRLRNSIVWSNSGGNWSVSGLIGGSFLTNTCTTPVTGLPGSGNLEAEPLFADAAGGDFRLDAASPCIDAGANQPWMEGAADLRGRPRLDPVSGIVDIGCHEFRPPPTVIWFR